MRNKEMDLLKAIGIIYVVGGHYYLPWIFGYPYGSFCMPLFFFISGYFFKSVDGFHVKLYYCLKKTKELLLPYFLYYVLFTIISYFLLICMSMESIVNSWGHDFLRYPMVLVLKPFFGGISIFFGASWFISDLWLILITMQFIYSNKNSNKTIDFVYFLCLLSLACAAIHWSSTSPRLTEPQMLANYISLNHNLFKLVLIRTWIGLLFSFFGIVYRVHIEKYQTYLFTGKTFCLAFIGICQLEYHYKSDIHFVYFNADFLSAPVWLPILTSVIGIFIFMFIAKCLSKHIADNDILIKIGNETYHIMCQHLVIFLSLNIITIRFFRDKNFKVLDWDISYKYKPQTNWAIFVGCGLLIPTFLAIYIRQLVKNLQRKYVFS